MAQDKIFVGRKAELEQFNKVLDDPRGQAVLVVGHRGMGKSWLADKMAELAENHPNLKCGCVRYEVTPTDSVDSIMALMMDNAFEAAHVTEGSFDSTPWRLQQWKALLNVIKIGDLTMSLRREPTKNTREQFLERLQLISKRMTENGRAIFIIDPEKYMQKDSDQSWTIVVKELPDKIKLIFAQRTEDVLVESGTFSALDNVSRIPEKRLGVLEEQAVDELLNQRVTDMDYKVSEVRNTLSKYQGHPYALQGALDLLKTDTKLEEIPQDPTGIAFAQWKELCKRGKNAIRLFKAYAILEVGVPDEIVIAVSKLDTDTLQSVLADTFLGGLLREEGYGKRIYHVILSDYVLEQIDEVEKKEYHSRAVVVYRQKLAKAKKHQIMPDALAATRLPEHVLFSEGREAFVGVFTNECYGPLKTLGLLDAAIGFSKRALEYVENGTPEEASVLGNSGLVYLTHGDLLKAEEMFKRTLTIHKKLRHQEGMASDYNNLALVYANMSDFDNAEEMHQRALDIDQSLHNEKGMANQYGNLCGIYRKRGDLDKAESTCRKALEIYETLNIAEGMALQYGNLGQIYRMKGHLNMSTRMHKRSLEIAEDLGYQELIAHNCIDLSIIYMMIGKLDAAQDISRKALEIAKMIEIQDILASAYGNLGAIHITKGEVDKAEEMSRKSLDIAERLGMQEVIANQYANLGQVYKERGNLRTAQQHWQKSLKLFEKIDMPHMVKKVQGWIDELVDK
jgi:tetratricopeptide (TPR) repeat protein/energy-coupling factor transporter ATP-binding protein EcfA2